MSKQELIEYLKEYFDEMIEEAAQEGMTIDYKDCLNTLLTEITN